jgi:alpha-D-ribose 1-methylphosphonate 5-triphosphate synthase subunit PhnG
MQAFEAILIKLKTGNKKEAIEDYAYVMGISKEEAEKAINNLMQYSRRVQKTAIKRTYPYA